MLYYVKKIANYEISFDRAKIAILAKNHTTNILQIQKKVARIQKQNH